MTRTNDLETLQERHADLVGRELGLDLTRGKPSPDQLALSEDLDGILDGDFHGADGTDLRNYGGTTAGIAEVGAWLMDVPAGNVHAGNNASLEFMWHVVALHHIFGVDGPDTAWRHRDAPKVLCPVPGYDRHFSVTERMGIEMVPVPMGADGPDMDVVEDLVRADPDIVAMWCVPKYANPTGVVYGDDVVDRIARLATIAGPHFRVLWDNAYAGHDLTDEPEVLASAWEACTRHDTLASVIHFASTSKITFAGSGVAFIGASTDNLAALRHHLSLVTIGPDKVNQQRHVRFFPDRPTLIDHMAQHATILRPKFELVAESMESELDPDGAHGRWTTPQGGYFVSFWSQPGLASEIVALAAEAGVALTPAGAAFPYRSDPDDSHIRLAPSFPSLEELTMAMEVFTTCVRLATARRAAEG